MDRSIEELVVVQGDFKTESLGKFFLYIVEIGKTLVDDLGCI